MSDETEVTPELDEFAEQLRQSKPPAAKIDRDQLMYDAGWAAAMASIENAPVHAKSTIRNGFLTSMALSFCGGVAAAAALLITFLPTNDGSAIQMAANDVVPTGQFNSDADRLAEPSLAVTQTDLEQDTDLLEWLESLPAGHTVSSGFSSRPVSLELADTDSVPSANPVSRAPRTSQRIMRELIPGVQTRKTIPAWTSWLSTGM